MSVDGSFVGEEREYEEGTKDEEAFHRTTFYPRRRRESTAGGVTDPASEVAGPRR